MSWLIRVLGHLTLADFPTGLLGRPSGTWEMQVSLYLSFHELR